MRINAGALRDAMSGPGADSRAWVSHVLLTGEPVVEAGGVYCDGRLEPTGEDTTVRLRPLYVAPQGAIYLPAAKGDLLVCVFPSGDAAGGAVEVARLFSDEDPVPAEVRAKPLDLWIIAAEGRDIRLSAPGGTLELSADLISLRTTGAAATSRVFVDGVSFFSQRQTPMGPSVGPPISDPSNPNALALQQWEAAEAAGE